MKSSRPSDEELKKSVKEVAKSLGLDYIQTNEALKYLPKLRKLGGSPRLVLSLIEQKSMELEARLGIRIELSRSELLEEIKAYAFHEAMHGVVWEKLGPLRPARYLPEEYWIMGLTDMKYGSQRFDGHTFLDYAFKNLTPWNTIIEHTRNGGLYCENTPDFARVLYFHTKEELTRIHPSLGEFFG